MVRKIMKYLYCLVGGGATRWDGVGVFKSGCRGVFGVLKSVLESGRRGGYEYGVAFGFTCTVALITGGCARELGRVVRTAQAGRLRCSGTRETRLI